MEIDLNKGVFLGTVSVDSGTLHLVDPCYKENAADAMETYIAAINAANGPESVTIGKGAWGSSLVVPTGVGDGIFPVYRVGDHSILIDIDQWFWDNEDGKGIIPMSRVIL